VADRADITAELNHAPPRAVVISTMAVPDVQTVDAPLCLILREVLPSKLAGFRLANGRLWDLVIVPNPADEWMPDLHVIGARRVEPVGWIYRRPGTPTSQLFAPADGSTRTPHVLVTSGGGSGDDEHAELTEALSELIARLRRASPSPIDVVHVRGPNSRAGWSIPGADRTIEPGSTLHNMFGRADLVVSTAGYNSVLELACTDVPVLLLPIGRYSDDQHKRARLWGPRLGLCYDTAQPNAAVEWMTGVLERRSRRPPVDLGASGAGACAALIESVLA
jgi:predicted glycosyltransferase